MGYLERCNNLLLQHKDLSFIPGVMYLLHESKFLKRLLSTSDLSFNLFPDFVPEEKVTFFFFQRKLRINHRYSTFVF